MKQTQCSLCEGRIVDGRCQECGMYYRPIQGRYYLNENRSRKEPAEQNVYPQRTGNHTAGDTRKKSAAERMQTKNSFETVRKVRPVRPASHQRGEVKTKSKAGVFLYAIFLLVIVGVTALKRFERHNAEEYVESADAVASVNIAEFVEEGAEGKAEIENTEIERAEGLYDQVTREIPQDGEEFEIDLTAGRYVIGQNLPEGIYRAQAGEDMFSTYLNLQDAENFIYYTWWLEDYAAGETQYEVEDIRLYSGAILNINGAGSVRLLTSNAQTDNMPSPKPNPLTEEVQVTNRTMTAGEDFADGVYDVELRRGSGTLHVSDVEGFQDIYYFSLNAAYDSKSYRNLVLAPGMQVYLDDYVEGQTVLKLIPSKEIFSDAAEE